MKTTEFECCSDCAHKVYPEDPFYSSPCGTFCSECMRKHVECCEICADEFEAELIREISYDTWNIDGES